MRRWPRILGALLVAAGSVFASEVERVVPDALGTTQGFESLGGLPSASGTTRSTPRLTGTPLLRVWTPDDYGASPLNTHVLVHPDGLVYVSNDDGLLEFDGEHWRLIPLPRHGAARALALDAQHRLWVFGHDDAARMEPDGRGGLRAVSVLEELPREARTTGSISRAATTRDGIYVRGQRRLMLFRPDGSVRTWPGADLNGLIWSQGDDLYASLGGLVRVSPDGIEPVDLGGSAPAGPLRIFAARQEPNGPDWLLIGSHGPLLWAGPGFPLRPLSAEAAAAFGGLAVSAGAFLADGRIALGTERGGIYIYDSAGRFSQHFDRDDGLPSRRVDDLAVDEEGGLWAAMDDGIARLDLASPFALHGARQGLAGSPRRLASWNGEVYVATSEGVSRRDAATGQFHSIAGFEVGSNRPLAVGGRLVAATRGLREILPGDRSRLWTHELIGPIAADPRASGWIYAGSSGNLWLLQPASGGWKTAGALAGFSLGFDELLPAADGWLWGVTRDGQVARVDFRQGPRRRAPFHVFNRAEGIPAAGRDDRLGIVSVGAEILVTGAHWIRRFDSPTGRFEAETRLPDAGARLAGPSGTGGAWIQSGRDPGVLTRVEAGPDGWRMSRLLIAPFQGPQFDSLFDDPSDHTLWLAGQNLLVSVDLAWRPVRPRTAPRVQVRKVRTAAGEALVWSGSHPLRLEPGQNALRIEFAAQSFDADFRGRDLNLYRTRLVGLDDGWTDWREEDRRDFTNLPYRTLRFEVQARVPGRPDSEPFGFTFSIAPPFWLTAWAFVLYAAALAGAILLLLRVRTRVLQRRNRELAATVASRTRQLERLNQELTDSMRAVGHDLRGSVSAIRSLSRQLKGTASLFTSQEGPEFLGEIERTSGAVMDMMSRLLDLERANERAAGLTTAPADVGAIVKGVAGQFGPAAAAKKIALQVDAPLEMRVIDADGVASVVANLIGNAIKFLPEDGRGRIEVRLRFLPRQCQLTVADNGPGVPAAERESVFGKFSKGTARPTAGEASTGLGLFMVKKLVTAMGGTIEVGETVGGGATFTVVWTAV